MFYRSRKAFTLIELLIVVAIIGVLAAIAVPNFMNARMRAKITRVAADMRNIGVAFGAYAVDYNEYPLGFIAFCNPPQSDSWGFLPTGLTTPVPYMTTLPVDEYNLNYKIYGNKESSGPTSVNDWKAFYRTARKKPYLGEGSRTPAESWTVSWKTMLANTGIDGEYIITSPGPDHTEDILPPYNPKVYAVSNGLLSSGDIVYAPGGVAGI